MIFRVLLLFALGLHLWGQEALVEGFANQIGGTELDWDKGKDQEVQPETLKTNTVHGIKKRSAVASQEDQAPNTLGSPVPRPGKTYIRWGRTSCRDGAQLVYEGVMAGKYYNYKGSGTNYLCLNKTPEFHNPVSGTSTAGWIWGTEAESVSDIIPTLPAQSEVPCAVCMASTKQEALMIPGSKNCPSEQEWEKEYQGYLASAWYGHYATEYICLDYQATGIPQSGASNNPAMLYKVEARCSGNGGGLPCPPYVDGYEVTCVVCSI